MAEKIEGLSHLRITKNSPDGNQESHNYEIIDLLSRELLANLSTYIGQYMENTNNKVENLIYL